MSRNYHWKLFVIDFNNIFIKLKFLVAHNTLWITLFISLLDGIIETFFEIWSSLTLDLNFNTTVTIINYNGKRRSQRNENEKQTVFIFLKWIEGVRKMLCLCWKKRRGWKHFMFKTSSLLSHDPWQSLIIES